MATTAQCLNELVNQKNALAEILVEKGIEADKSEKFNTLIPKVADIQGGNKQLEDLFNASTDNGTNFHHLFYTDTWLVEAPMFDMHGVLNTSAMFYGDTNLTTIPEYDLSTVTNAGTMFNGCKKLVSVPTLNFSSVKNMGGIFGNCTSLERIEGMILSSKVQDGGYAGAFNNCTALTYIRIQGTIANAINFSQSPLDLESCKSVLLALHTFTAASHMYRYSVTFSESSWTLIDADGANSPDGTTWREYITSKGWNY